MKHKKAGEKLIGIFFCLMILGCSAYGKEKVPYLAGGEFVLASSDTDFEAAGIDLYFYNKSEKPVLEFTVVFYLFDEDGEPIGTGKNNIVLTIQKEIDGMSVFQETLDLDRYFGIVPDVQYTVDFLYISKIVYGDGSTWKDPLGLMAF